MIICICFGTRKKCLSIYIFLYHLCHYSCKEAAATWLTAFYIIQLLLPVHSMQSWVKDIGVRDTENQRQKKTQPKPNQDKIKTNLYIQKVRSRPEKVLHKLCYGWDRRGSLSWWGQPLRTTTKSYCNSRHQHVGGTHQAFLSQYVEI